MKTTNAALLHNGRASWRKWMGLMFSLILSLPPSLLAQNQPVKFERIGLEQGLSQSSVYCILQDHQGFMWFGTQAGLNKYDGYKFTVYQQDIFDLVSTVVG